MALFDVKAFEADAEVLGKVRTVHYDNQGNLRIMGLSVGEAKQCLSLLSAGLTVETLDGPQRHGYEAPPQSGPPQVDQPAEPAPEAKPQAAVPAKPKGKGRGKAKPKPKEEAKPAAGNGAGDPAGNVVDLDDARQATGEDLVEQVAKKTKLKDVILVLRDAGFDEINKLVAECLRIQEQVPVLKKITNMEDRVKRVWERVSA